MAFCNEDGCQVLTTGKCVNDLVLNECPHYKETDEDDLDQEDNEATDDEPSDDSKSTNNLFEVYSGKALKIDEVNRISKSAVTRLIILAGMPDAGKTTLLLSLMHLFQTRAEFENFLFAGSETLLDFEEKAHPSKAESENLQENTGRTPIGPPTFLHLAVFNKTSQKTTNLVFTDISGELFNALKDSTEQCKKFTLAERADHFVMLFDADRITTLKDRASAKTSGVGIIKSLVQAGTLKPHTRIQIIFSRWDLYLKKGKQAIHEEFIELLKNDLKTQFGDTFDLTFVDVSARPKKGQLEFGYGIDKIFPDWVTKSILDRQFESVDTKPMRGNRQFLQYEFKD
ncbi:TRAFAC clade GTPase domain-containing protein [Mucilaginibacter sp. FT3.2]|uniref:TRAFAC clade GTPase domain-containing protein n=1 Tax=Mucilaginibacter sp. FT3.2 TaxID=2723090 RepID=UPI001619550D|nr:hypothetical protein [Mucilaginibacter sp. FT3.2]MBB6232426.1 hypothetical protein [Mucilaginibacter sp. FT3.2]